MAVVCARCGAQNPDGNRFCTACGTPLGPAGAPSQPYYAPQPGYQSPYYAPQPGMATPAVHRTPWVLIISIVVAVVLVLSGVGTVLAFALGSRHNTQSSPFSALSSPSPAVTPSPGDTPAPSPSAQPTGPGSGQTVTTSTVGVVVPSGWQVLNKDANSVTVQSPDGDGTLTVASGESSPPQTAQQIKDAIDKALVQHYPDAAPCPNSSSDNGAISGVNGIFWTMCFTATGGGQSVSIAEPIWAGATAGGSVAYVVVLQTTQDNTDAFVQKCMPILKGGITWSLK